MPAYNERLRLPSMLKETLKYLLDRKTRDRSFTFEIIVVDDGSRDATTEVALDFVVKYGANIIRVLTLSENQGKGGAVQQGMLNARGAMLLMADADGASEFICLERLEKALKNIESNGLGIAIGSRAHMQEDAVATRAWYRNILMFGFHFLVSSLSGISGINDTQCGFKLFTRKTAQLLFCNQHVRRWCFDVELLYIAQSRRVPIREVPINWTEVVGSKLDVFDASFQMARDLAIIRLSYLFGLWRIENPDSPRLVAVKVRKVAAEPHTLKYGFGGDASYPPTSTKGNNTASSVGYGSTSSSASSLDRPASAGRSRK